MHVPNLQMNFKYSPAVQEDSSGARPGYLLLWVSHGLPAPGLNLTTLTFYLPVYLQAYLLECACLLTLSLHACIANKDSRLVLVCTANMCVQVPPTTNGINTKTFQHTMRIPLIMRGYARHLQHA